METRGFTERTKDLRKQSVEAVPRLCMERARLVTEADKLFSGTAEIPIVRAKIFQYLMENRTLCINPGEWIVGEKGVQPQHAPSFPELCCHTMEDLEVMDQRKHIFFKVDDEAKKIQETIVTPYWENRSLRKLLVDHMTPEWKACYEAGMFTEFMEQRGPGHTVADGKLYRKGFLDVKNDIQEAIENLDSFNDPEAYDKKVQLQAMAITCDGIMILGQRYEALARTMADTETDPVRKAELLKIAEVCSVVPAHKPQTFHQALQMYWFVHLGVTLELNPWDALSPGRLDQHLNPFYETGLKDGTLTRETARELLECFWIKFNNQPAPPKVGITLKESSTYTDFANLNTGGVRSDGSDGVNPVSYLILETMDEMRLLQPSSNVQISRKTPQDFLKKACEVSRKGWGQPAFYNTDAIIQEMLRAGKELEDAREGGASGCVETGAFGKEAFVLTGYLNVPKILQITLHNGIDEMSGVQLGLKTGDPRTFTTYEELFEAFKKQLKHFVDIKVAGNNIIEKLYARNMPVPFLSTIISDCISKGKDYNAGGARYNTNYIQCVGIGTITDSLSAIKHLVFEKNRFTLAQLLDSMAKNYEGADDILHLVSNRCPKYGNDDDAADSIMRETFDALYNEITGRVNMKGGVYRIDMLPTTCHVYFGSVMGAGPNGRLAHKPLSEGISPEKGADRKGPTAVIKSCAKMEHLKTGGTLLNQKFTPSVVAGEQGIDNLSSLIRAYFNMDGHHIQFNVIDRKTLLDAQQRPEAYKDLIVRVAGYSDHFHNLSKELQDEIIDRTEQSFN